MKAGDFLTDAVLPLGVDRTTGSRILVAGKDLRKRYSRSSLGSRSLIERISRTNRSAVAARAGSAWEPISDRASRLR